MRRTRSPGRLAKIARPAVPRAYRRARLFRVLDKARRAHAAVWVTAPAGAGKTTLVASYVEARKVGCLWYQADSGDGDLSSFFHYLSVACAQSAPRFRRALPRLTPEYLADVPTFTRNYFRELGRRLRGPFVLVFDNLHEVADPRFHQVICAGLHELPDGVGAVLISRAAPPEAFARMRVSHALVEVGWPHLRLQPGEARSVVRSVLGSRLPSVERTDALYRRCEGWVAGLILMAGSNTKGEMRSRIALDSAAPQTVFDYFAAEVFARWDPAVREFLMQTALLPSFTAAMARRLTQDDLSGRRLEHLARQHHFTERHAEPGETYQYHSLFREFLVEQGRAQWSTALSTRYRRRAASVLEEAGQVEDALALYLDLEDASSATRLVIDQAESLAAAGRLEALGATIARLPAPVSENHPWLLYWAGVCRMPVDVLASRRSLEKAHGLFAAAGERVGMLLTAAQVAETYFYELADFEPLDRWIAVLDELTASGGEAGPAATIPLPAAVEAHATVAMFSALMHRQPQRADMEAWGERALAVMVATGDVQRKMILGYQLLFYFTCWQGDLAKAQAVVDHLRPAAASRDASPLARVVWHTIQVYYCWMWGEPEKALAASQAGLATAEASGVRVWDVMLFMTGACASLALNRVDDAEAFLARMNAVLLPGQAFNNAMYQDMVGVVALWRHDGARARAQTTISLGLAERCGAPFARAICNITRALTEAEGGDHAQAMDHLQVAQGIAAAMRGRYIEYLHLFARARLALAQGLETVRVLSALREAMAAGREGRFFHHIGLPADAMASLCALALENDVEVEYVREFIRRRRLTATYAATRLERWPFALKVYTLGAFKVEVRDAPLRFSTKTQQKPLDLLQALVALGGKDVAEDLLGDALWPSSDADRAALALTTTVHRLRKLVGAEAIVHRAGTLTLDSRHCWVDAWALEHDVQALEQASRSDGADGVVETVGRVCERYRGPFLGAAGEQAWALPMRERLQGRVLRALRSGADRLLAERLDDDARRCLERALEIDPLAEETYRQLMRSQLACGHRAEALSTYERCRKTLATVLDLEPSPDTEALKQRIRAS